MEGEKQLNYVLYIDKGDTNNYSVLVVQGFSQNAGDGWKGHHTLMCQRYMVQSVTDQKDTLASPYNVHFECMRGMMKLEADKGEDS